MRPFIARRSRLLPGLCLLAGLLPGCAFSVGEEHAGTHHRTQTHVGWFPSDDAEWPFSTWDDDNLDTRLDFIEVRIEQLEAKLAARTRPATSPTAATDTAAEHKRKP